MREILFKAKRFDNGKWIVGSLVVLDADSGYYFITESYPSASTLPVRNLIYEHTHLVEPKTICQYTGLTDHSSNKIWEHDIVKDRSGDIYTISYEELNGCFEVRQYGCCIYTFETFFACDCEVIGNIFDNPELLEEGD